MKQAWKKTLSLSAGLMLGATAFTGIPAVPASAAKLLLAEFETTNDSFTSRGDADVQWTSDQSYTGECSLFVSGRTAAWHGAIRDASSLMRAGETYALSAAVYQASGAPVEMKFSLQYSDSSGKATYSQIALETAENESWLVLSNPSYTVPVGATNISIYVETTESTTDFYLDTVSVTGSPAVIKKGDANGDLKVDVADAVQLMRFLCASSDEIEQGADYDSNGVINAVDLSLLKHTLLYPTVTPLFGDWDNYQETASPAMLKVYQDGVYRVGNTARIREKIAKAQAGEKVTIGYIGGSITGGGSSSSESKRFVNLSANYFSETFGQGNNVSFVNAGAAGTSSVVGNMRVDKDIFSKNCDIIFIEFAVNDQDGDRFKKSYEALVKKCLMQENAPAVVLITLCTKSGGGCQDWMARIGENYDLPVISGKNAIMNAINAGTLSWDANYGSGDTLHPGDGGHKLIADCIAYYYRQALRSENASDSYEIPNKTVFGDEYATAHLVDIGAQTDFSAGSWSRGTNSNTYGIGYTYSKNGNTPLSFTVKGKGILLLFQSNDKDNMGAVNVTVNGKTSTVNSKLSWTWGGMDGDLGYYQPNSDTLNISISSKDSKDFVLYGIAVID